MIFFGALAKKIELLFYNIDTSLIMENEFSSKLTIGTHVGNVSRDQYPRLRALLEKQSEETSIIYACQDLVHFHGYDIACWEFYFTNCSRKGKVIPVLEFDNEVYGGELAMVYAEELICKFDQAIQENNNSC